MCGICGFNWEDRDLIKGMTKVLVHRGPDRGGVYTDEKVSLGHRRLSIIDLSEDGNQPMYNEDGTLLIVYNGEIYNFKELRKELEAKGHRFISNTDTEVILHGYEQWGEAVVEKLNGMFAFCLYDLEQKKLFLARDRLGIKPLYYYWAGDRLVFSSEIKAILLAGIPREVNLNLARQYLQLRYVPGVETLFSGIKKLLPGNTLTLKEGKIKIKPFWDLPLPQVKKNSLGKTKKEFGNLLLDSIQRRLIADVRVGVYLSGGIDSASITALAAKIKEDEPVKTFSVGFDYNDEVDELNQARVVAETFQTDHHEIVVQDNISEMLPKLVWHLDMPHGDPVIIPQFRLSELAASKVKVVLSGEGADELLGGYVQYKTFLQAQKTKLVPTVVKSTMARVSPVKLLDKFFDYPSSVGEKGKEKIIDFFSHLKEKEKAYQDLTSIMSKKDKDLLFTNKLKPKEVGGWNLNQPQTSTTAQDYFQSERQPLLNQMLYYDTKRWLPNYVLFINDRMTMANSIEGRVPFLDHRMAEYSTTLPAKYKLRGGQTKFILRQTMKKILPSPNIKKHAFFMPLDHWYKEELKDLAERLFSHAQVKKRGYFNYYYLKRIWEKYNQSKLIYGKQLFTLINFELWHRLFIDEEKIPVSSDVKLKYLV